LLLLMPLCTWRRWPSTTRASSRHEPRPAAQGGNAGQRADRLISSRRNLTTPCARSNTALNLTGAELGSFRLLDKATGRLRLVALVGAVPDLRRDNLPPEETSGVVGWVARHRQPVCIADLHQPPWAEIYRPLTERRVMRSELAVPLLGPGDGLEGVVNVESPHLAHFDAEANRAGKLATRPPSPCKIARLLDTIEEVTERMVGHPPDAVFALVLDRACDLLSAYAAAWELESQDADSLRLRAFTATSRRATACRWLAACWGGPCSRASRWSASTWPATNAWAGATWRTAWAGTRR
jgi:hypothetical protein